ncbi:hypothetical protein [Pseudoxanthobacter sp.]|uniref:hypothetical protein n=1 Tax=Pseudoxanthobacter sp. TaxID=1925742 RepID=UPI002FE0D65A
MIPTVIRTMSGRAGRPFLCAMARGVALAAALAAAAGGTAALAAEPPGAQAAAIALSPAAIDIAAICGPAAPVRPARDWTGWKAPLPAGLSRIAIVEDAAVLAAGWPDHAADPDLALQLLQAVMDEGGPAASRARHLAGRILIDNRDDPNARVRGRALLEQALREGMAASALVLARADENGATSAPDMAGAEGYYRRALAAGEARAGFALAALYHGGSRPEPAPDAAMQAWALGLMLTLQDLSAGRCGGLYDLARAYLDPGSPGRDPALGIAWLRRAAEAGGPGGRQAAYELGSRLLRGDEVSKDRAAALAVLDQASQAGDLPATRLLAAALAGGEGGKPGNTAAAMAVLERGVRAGDPRAMLQLGRLEVAGGGRADPARRARAAALFRAALARPDPPAEAFAALARLEQAGGDTVPDEEAFSVTAEPAEITVRAAAYETVAPALARRLYREAALLGDAPAGERLVAIYRCGLGVVPDEAEALVWRERAIAAGSSDLLRERAEEARLRGDGAARLADLLQAAGAGDRRAMAALIVMYRHGDGVAADPHRAAIWRARLDVPGEGRTDGLVALAEALAFTARTAAERAEAGAILQGLAAAGDPEGRFAFASFLLTPRGGGQRDRLQGLALSEAAAAAGNGAARGRQARLAAEEFVAGTGQDAAALVATLQEREQAAGCNPRALVEVAQGWRALAPFSPVADAATGRVYARAGRAAVADMAATAAVGMAMRRGDVPGATAEDAAALLRRAAADNYAPAQRELAEMMLSGEIAAPDRAQAMTLLERAADRGDGPAAIRLAAWVETDPQATPAARAAAVARLRRAADAGAPDALREMGLRLLGGNGVAADRSAGLELLERAAGAGDRLAMRELAQALTDATDAAGRRKRLFWLRQAAALGDRDAIYSLTLEGAAPAEGAVR